MATERGVQAIKASGPKETTHRADCPKCERVTWIRFMSMEAHTRESCQHFAGMIVTGARVEVKFGDG